MEEFINFNEAQQVNVYNEGVKTEYSAGRKEYEKIIAGWYSMIDGAHDMPAFGVSLNDYTVKELQKGLWVEFDFKSVKEHNGMPFEKLLIHVNKDYYGFNLIRYNQANGYDGRCFYLDLVNKNMDVFYDLLNSI